MVYCMNTLILAVVAADKRAGVREAVLVSLFVNGGTNIAPFLV